MEEKNSQTPPEDEPKRPPLNSSPGWEGSDIEELPGEHPDLGEDISLPPGDPWEDGVEDDT